jgi:hypothetical protein
MSLGYAERLSFREDLGGRLGAPEIFDDAACVVDGAERLAGMVCVCVGGRLGKQGRAWPLPSGIAPRPHSAAALPPGRRPRRCAPRAASSRSPAPASQRPAASRVRLWSGGGGGALGGGGRDGAARGAPPQGPPRSRGRPQSAAGCGHLGGPTPSAATHHPPDFRGPSGVWTLQRANKPLPRLQTSFLYAKPSLTHMVGCVAAAVERASRLS